MASFDEGRRAVGHFGIEQVSAGRRSDLIDLPAGFDEGRRGLENLSSGIKQIHMTGRCCFLSMPVTGHILPLAPLSRHTHTLSCHTSPHFPSTPRELALRFFAQGCAFGQRQPCGPDTAELHSGLPARPLPVHGHMGLTHGGSREAWQLIAVSLRD